MEKQKVEQKSMEIDIGELIMHKKIAKMITVLLQENKWTLSKLSKETGLSFPYVIKKVKEFEKIGIIITTKEGKNRIIALTEKGAKIAIKINEIFANIYEENVLETQAKKEEMTAESKRLV